MQLTAITLARASILITIEALDPRGRTILPETVKTFREKYSFAKVPEKIEELNLQKGIELALGKMGDINIEQLTLFANGVVVDTRSSTEDSEKVILDLIGFARDTFGAVAEISRRLFLSQLTFQSDMELRTLHPALQPIADQLTKSVSRDLKQSFPFEPVAVFLNTDPTLSKLNPGAFSIERKLDTPFSENSYFSTAPVRTSEHIELIQQLEAGLKGPRGLPRLRPPSRLPNG